VLNGFLKPSSSCLPSRRALSLAFSHPGCPGLKPGPTDKRPRTSENRQFLTSLPALLSFRLLRFLSESPLPLIFMCIIAFHSLKPEWSPRGLSEDAARSARATHGLNVYAAEQRGKPILLLFSAIINPFNLLLLMLAVISIATGDKATFTVMILMIVSSTGLRCLLIYLIRVAGSFLLAKLEQVLARNEVNVESFCAAQLCDHSRSPPTFSLRRRFRGS
jgi:hypothetical protein